MYRCSRTHINTTLDKRIYNDDVVSNEDYEKMFILEQMFFTHDENDDIIDAVIDLGVAAVTLGVFDGIFDGSDDDSISDNKFDGFGGGDGGGGGADDDY